MGKAQRIRYFVSAADREKGPYKLQEIEASVQSGHLSGSVLVRAENEDATRPLSEVIARARAAAESRKPSTPRRAHAEPSAEAADQGSFLLGLLAGALGGLVVLALVLRRGKPDTRTGVSVGVAVQVFLFMIGVYRC